MGLTPRQTECLHVIKAHVREKGYPPTLDEIRKAMGFSTRSGIKHLIDALVNRGHVVRDDFMVRGLKVVEPDNHHGPDCLCATCPARRLQYQQLIQGLQTPAKLGPGVILTGLRPLSDIDRLHWARGFPKPARPAVAKRSAVP